MMSTEKLGQEDLFAKLEGLEQECALLRERLARAEGAEGQKAIEQLTVELEREKEARGRAEAALAELRAAHEKALAEAEASLERRVAERLRVLGVRVATAQGSAGGHPPGPRAGHTERVLAIRGFKTLEEALTE